MQILHIHDRREAWPPSSQEASTNWTSVWIERWLFRPSPYVPSSLFPAFDVGSCGIGQDCNGNGKMLQCDKCDLFFHFACQGFTSSPFEDEDEQLDSQQFCTVCRDTFRESQQDGQREEERKPRNLILLLDQLPCPLQRVMWIMQRVEFAIGVLNLIIM